MRSTVNWTNAFFDTKEHRGDKFRVTGGNKIAKAKSKNKSASAVKGPKKRKFSESVVANQPLPRTTKFKRQASSDIRKTRSKSSEVFADDNNNCSVSTSHK